MTPAQADWLDSPAPPVREDVFVVDVDGYEGPFDLLLDMARRQKVDLAGISVLALAEQYLAFIASMRDRRIEVAADYLVMAAWLTYLKSRLMVPQLPSDEEPSGEMLAAMLQFRLTRLEAMRKAASQLLGRPRLGIDIHGRGRAEPIVVTRKSQWRASFYDLLKAYSVLCERNHASEYTPSRRTVWSLQDARDILHRLVGDSSDWMSMSACLSPYLSNPEERVTALASSFASCLEMVRLGAIEIRQTEAFGPLFMRRRKVDAP